MDELGRLIIGMDLIGMGWLIFLVWKWKLGNFD